MDDRRPSASEAELRRAVGLVLSNVAPEIDLATLDPSKDLRDQIDLDSVDFMNFVIGLHKKLGIEIPDADLPRLATLDGCVAYLAAKRGRPS